MGYINKTYLKTQFDNFANKISSAFARKNDIPTKTSQLTNDSGFKSSDAITGVKGNAESSYRKGNINLTPADIGAATASHTHSSYVNQNAFSNVTVGSTTIAADKTTDTLTFAAGSNVTITPDATNDKITISSSKPTKVSQLENDSGYLVEQPNAGFHNSIYRGKFLGTSVTNKQYAAISAGTFNDLYIGDYWTINEVNWRIAAFDYYLGCGDAETTDHHVVIVPDTSLYDYVMNDTNTTADGYVGSKMYKQGLEQAKTTIKSAFSGHVLNHRVFLVNGISNGAPSSGAWYDSEAELMNEQMVYGGSIYMPMGNGSSVFKNQRAEKSQLPLFTHEPSRIGIRANYWLRDAGSDSFFACVQMVGLAYCWIPSSSYGVRPAFCIF